MIHQPRSSTVSISKFGNTSKDIVEQYIKDKDQMKNNIEAK